jgi:hypothetical protein
MCKFQSIGVAMNYEARLRKLEACLNPGQLVAIPIKVSLSYPNGADAEEHAEPLEKAYQRYLDGGGVVPTDRDLVVLVKKFT